MYKLQIREYLPTRDFKPMVGILNKLFNFMKMTGTMVSSKSIKVVPSNRHQRSVAFWIVWTRPFRLYCPIKWGSKFFPLKKSLVDRRGEMQYFFPDKLFKRSVTRSECQVSLSREKIIYDRAHRRA